MKCDLCEKQEAFYMFNKLFGAIYFQYKQIDYICLDCVRNLAVFIQEHWIRI